MPAGARARLPRVPAGARRCPTPRPLSTPARCPPPACGPPAARRRPLAPARLPRARCRASAPAPGLPSTPARCPPPACPGPAAVASASTSVRGVRRAADPDRPTGEVDARTTPGAIEAGRAARGRACRPRPAQWLGTRRLPGPMPWRQRPPRARAQAATRNASGRPGEGDAETTRGSCRGEPQAGRGCGAGRGSATYRRGRCLPQGTLPTEGDAAGRPGDASSPGHGCGPGG